jgi:hypothetical protein
MFFLYFLFFPTKSEHRRAKQMLPRGEVRHHWEGGGIGDWGRRVNIVQKMYTHVSKCINDLKSVLGWWND